MAEAGGGRATVRANVIATTVFAVACVVALLWRHRGWAEAGFVGLSLVLFAVGVATALVAYAGAVERSRTSDIGVAALYLLSGPVAPRTLKWRMHGAWAVQIVGALTVGILGSIGLGSGQRNVLAFGSLVPMLGIGLNGLWSSRHGSFGPRQLPQKRKIG